MATAGESENHSDCSFPMLSSCVRLMANLSEIAADHRLTLDEIPRRS